MSKDPIKKLFYKQKQNRWNLSKTTAEERIKKLKQIYDSISFHRKDIQTAIFSDFKKNPCETDMTEIYPTLAELKHTINNLKSWMKPKAVKTPMALLGTKSEIHYEAKGLVLILSPWNYPFQLSMIPVITAIAAGNAVILKPSSKVPQTAHFLESFFSHLFDENEVAVLNGDSSIADKLLNYPFDHIFFTGSIPIGKKVMTAAANNLTPITLELGGKSPVIIDETANIKTAAERIMWGKFINAGQTCVAPDYICIHEKAHDAFIRECKKVIEKRYGNTETEQKQNDNFCQMVSKKNLQTLKKILNDTLKEEGKIALGGQSDVESRFFAPTLVTDISANAPIMQDEIFGPVLPILKYKDMSFVFDIIQERPKPLALYIFSNNQENINMILQNTSSGGTCVNTLVVHLANHHLPFGGVGHSGMGNYHGFFGFRTLSHERAVLKQGRLDMLKNFYPPYTKKIKSRIENAIKFLT